jgi:hypothetical protein
MDQFTQSNLKKMMDQYTQSKKMFLAIGCSMTLVCSTSNCGDGYLTSMDPSKHLLFFLQVYVAIPLPSSHLCSRSPTLTHLQQLLIAKMTQGKHTSALMWQNTLVSSQNSATTKQKTSPKVIKAPLPVASTKSPTPFSPTTPPGGE